jgi:hypothetical protein
MTRSRQGVLGLTEWDVGADFEPSEGPGKVDSAEDLFASQCRSFMLPMPERQVLFAKASHGRMWRFDFCWRQYMVAVEIEGIVPRRLPSGMLVMAGRHGSVAGVIEDMEKYNTAALLGWTVLRFPPKYVKPKKAIEATMRVLAVRGWTQ